MKEKLLLLDCSTAGVSGDRLLAALLELGVPSRKILDVVEKSVRRLAGVRSIRLRLRTTRGEEVSGVRLDADVEEERAPRLASEFLELAKAASSKVRMSSGAQEYASRVAETLVKAESKVHGEPETRLRLHELGEADTLVDIIGTSLALDHLGAFEGVDVFSTPPALGRGFAVFSAGRLPVPVPAVAEILRMKRFPSVGGPVEGELTTPTGAALLVNAARPMDAYPACRVLRVGYGIGKKRFPGLPNLVRAVLAEAYGELFRSEEIRVLETNLDDVSGEQIGYALERLMEAGAKDVSVIPMLTKKNRPGHILKVIAEPGKVAELTRVLVEETGTLGVRELACRRHVVLREERKVLVGVKGRDYPVGVKVARDAKGRVLRVKPEFEDLKRLAEKTGIGLREAESIVQARVSRKMVHG